MPLPNYQVVLLDWSGAAVRVFDTVSFYDMRYSRALNDVGIIAITFPYSASLLADLNHLDYFAEVYRTHPITGVLEKEETYMLRLLHRFREGDEERIIAGGLSLNHLLSRRVIAPWEDPLAAGGYSTKAGPADVVMRSYVQEQAADLASAGRRFPGLTAAAIVGNGQSIGKRLRYENLLVSLQDMAKQSQMDFEVERTTGANLVARVHVIGTDRRKSVNYPSLPWFGLDPARGNMINPSLMFDNRDVGNYVYALGQGQEETRIVLPLWTDNITESPYNRVEFTEDVRESEKEDSLSLLTSAREALDARKPKREFTFDSTAQPPGNVYRLDWELGDRITIVWDEAEEELRVWSVEINISDSGETVTPSVQPI